MLLFLILMQLKHFIIDFPLQKPYQYLNKGTYGHPGGLLHSGLHAIPTLIIFMCFGFSFMLSALVALAEFVIHYHIDWAKVQITKSRGWSQFVPAESDFRRDRLEIYSNSYFNALGFDQLLHQLTYVAMTVLI